MRRTYIALVLTPLLVSGVFGIGALVAFPFMLLMTAAVALPLLLFFKRIKQLNWWIAVLGVAADCNLIHLDEVKVDHLGEDGGFGTADVDSGASSGDTGVEASGLEHSSDCARDRSVAGDSEAVFGGSGGGGTLRAA